MFYHLRFSKDLQSRKKVSVHGFVSIPAKLFKTQFQYDTIDPWKSSQFGYALEDSIPNARPKNKNPRIFSKVHSTRVSARQHQFWLLFGCVVGSYYFHCEFAFLCWAKTFFFSQKPFSTKRQFFVEGRGYSWLRKPQFRKDGWMRALKRVFFYFTNAACCLQSIWPWSANFFSLAIFSPGFRCLGHWWKQTVRIKGGERRVSSLKIV